MQSTSGRLAAAARDSGAGYSVSSPQPLHRLTVRDAMSPIRAWLSPSHTVAEAERILLAHDCCELYVVDEERQLIGVIPDYELLKQRLVEDHGRHSVADLMCVCRNGVDPNDPLSRVAATLRSNIHCQLPVVEGDRLIGVITRRGVLEILRRTTSQLHDWLSPPYSFELRSKTPAAADRRFIPRAL